MGNSTVKPENIDTAIQEAISDYIGNVKADLDVNLKGVAQKASRELKKGGSYKERTGKYTPDWTVTQRPGRSALQGETQSVHNRRHYQLTHLLEKGHVTRNGSRTKAYQHILPAEQAAQELAVEAVEQAVKSANGGI